MAWDLEQVTGFEHGQVQTATFGGAGGPRALWSGTKPAAASVTADAARTGSYGLRFAITGTGAIWSLPTNAINSTTAKQACIKFHIRVNDATPASETEVLAINPASATLDRERLFLQTDGKLRFVNEDEDATITSTNSLSDNTWHAVELRAFMAADGTRTLRMRVDGTDEQSDSETGALNATSNYTTLRFGPNTAVTLTVDYDDVVIWTSTSASEEASWPTNCDSDLRVQGHVPNADGAHSIGTGTYQNSAAGNITNGTTDAYTYIDDIRSIGTDYVAKTAGTEAIGTSYLRFEFENTSVYSESTSTPVGYQAIVGATESASQAENFTADVTCDGVTTTLVSADVGSTATIVFYRNPVELPSAAASDVDAMYMRFGSTDSTPNPRLQAAIIEVAYLPSVSTTLVDVEAVYLQAVNRASVW